MRYFFLLSLFFALHVPLFGQFGYHGLNDDEYYVRLLQISDLSENKSSFSLRPVTNYGYKSEDHPWDNLLLRGENSTHGMGNVIDISYYEPVLFQSYNTSLPRGTNDGRVWQGKGYNTAFSTGAVVSAGPVSIKFNPVVGMAQNRSFDLGPYSPPEIRTAGLRYPSTMYAYRDFLGNIDYVQRYGDSTYSWFDLGDSYIELTFLAFRVALSNQRIWAGPAVNNALQFGYSAPGFRHIYLGTYRPLKTPVGSFEFANIFGKTVESDYFSADRSIEELSVHSLIFVYQPWFTERLSIGLTRTYFFPYPDDFSQYRRQAKRLFEPGLRNKLSDNGEARGADPDNQIGSVFFRYVVPEHGFEFYLDYGRNDHNADLRDFRAQPGHHRGYTVGAIKTYKLQRSRLLSFSLELNQFEATRTALTRGNKHLGGWYTHGSQVLGYTNDGQIMGTGYGPGVNMQMLKTDLFKENGGVSFKVARIVYHNSRVDQFFEQIQLANDTSVKRWEVRNVEYMMGGEITAFLKYGLEVTTGIELSYIMNHHNIKENDLFNSRIELTLRKQIPGWKR